MTPRLITDAALPPAPPSDYDALALAIFELRQRLRLIAEATDDLSVAIGRARADLAHIEQLTRGATPPTTK